MRLALVSQDFPPALGGIQTFSLRVAEAFAQKGELVRVVAPSHPAASETDATLPFPMTRVPGRPDLLVLGLLPRLPVLFSRQRVDVALHAQWPTALASLVARRLTGYPRRIVIAMHGRELVFNPFPSGPLADAYAGLRRQILQRADLLLPNSHFTADLARDISPSLTPATPIWMGVDAEHFRPMNGDAVRARLGLRGGPVLLSVCRLLPRKGVAEVIEAMARLTPELPSLEYVVAGEGPDEGRLRALAAERGLADRVHFIGRIDHDELPLLYGACDVSILAARQERVDVESFGIVFLEASACAKPVIGTRVGGIPEAVADGVSGLLVPPGDPAALAGAIQRLLADPGLARQLGHQGRERVLETFTWAHVANRVRTALEAP